MDKIVKDALDAFEVIEKVEEHNRTAFREDIEFARLGKQWPEEVEKIRKDRPMLTVNKMPAIIRQVANDARQNRPSITVRPVEDGDKKTAEVMSGLIRNIEATSNADIAYDTAIDTAITGGFGYFGVNVDYACDDTFEKDIVIVAKPNPLAIYGDPHSQGADSSDWMTAFEVANVPQAQYEREHHGKQTIDWNGRWTDKQGAWLDQTAKTIRVATFWVREKTTRKLVLAENWGRAVYEDEIEKLRKQLYEDMDPGVTGQSRDVPSFIVKAHKVSPLETLESVTWAGKYIPLIPVYGEEVNVEGKRYFRSLIRDAKDPQRMFNYWRTAATELVALAPRVPFIGEEGTFSVDPNWNSANTASHAYLEYKKGSQRPERQPMPQLPAGMIQEALNSADDIKAVTGIYDASLGARSNETSGRAIMARQREGDVSTFHFIDNLTRSIRHAGRVVLDLIPKVYTGDRVIRVLGEDGKPVESTDANKAPIQVRASGEQHNPAEGIYNFGLGKYDLIVKAGPSYTTQREEAATMLSELVRANGESAPILGPAIIDNLDIPGGDKIVAALKAMMPPEARAAMDGENAEAQAANAQMQQMAQVIQGLQAQMAALQNDKSLEAEKLKVEQYKAATDRLQALGATITPEAVQQLVVATIEDVVATAGLLPGGAHEAPVEPGVSMPEPGMEMMGQEEPEPVGIMPPDGFGQPEGQQL